MRQDWPIFCSYLDRLIQRYSSVSNYQHTARDKIRWLRIVCTFCYTIYTTDILVYQLPFPLFCNFAIDIFKHVILRLICLHISRHLIYVNDCFTILYLQAIFLKHTFSSRLI